jgi:hypothetical protein
VVLLRHFVFVPVPGRSHNIRVPGPGLAGNAPAAPGVEEEDAAALDESPPLGLLHRRISMSRHPSPRTLPLLAVLALSASACGGASDAGEGRLAAAVDTVNGVPVLAYPDTPGPELPWRLDTLFVLGGYEQEDAAFQFGQIGASSVAGTESGSLYVLDGMASRVLGFDASGAPTGTWGREGGGPGELQMPGGLGIGPGDSLWVADRGNRRVTIYPPDPAREASEISLPEAASGLGGSLSIDATGLFGVGVIFSFTPGAEVSVPPQRLLHVTRSGELADTVWTVPPRAFDQVELTAGGSRMMMLMQRRFTPGFWWGRFSDGTFAVSDAAEYDVVFAAPDGTVIRRVHRAPPARAVTEEDRERARRQTREQAESSTSEAVRQSVEQRIEKMTFAEISPRITGLVVDGEDRLWVGVATDYPEETGRIDVYDRDGALLGEIRDPEFFPALFYGAGRAALVETDELDVPRVIVLALREGAAD